MSNENGRERGVLSPADREYLRGDKSELSEGSEYNTKRRIRNRVRNSLLDFTLLFEHLDESEREKIFGSNVRATMDVDEDLWEGIRDTLGFVLEGAGAATPTVMGSAEKPVSGSICDRLLEDALQKVGDRNGYLVKEVRLNVDATRMPWSNLRSRLKEGDELPPEALRFLLHHENVDVAEVQDQIRDMVLEEDKKDE